MKKLFLFILLSHVLFVQAQKRVISADAQIGTAGNRPGEDIEKYSDDFTEASKLTSWKQFHEVENYPNKIRTATVQNGILTIQPFASGWFADYQGPFMYKTVTGDFDVRAKVKVSGLNSALPQTEWSLAGLMVRQAKNSNSSNWQPLNENWLFLTTGIAEPKGVAVFETKTTNNSMSNLKLRPAKNDWVELRIVRVRSSFLLLYRYEGEQWTLLDRFYRPFISPQVQLGLTAYSGWNDIPMELKQDVAKFNNTLLKDIPTDMQVQVDYVHFQKPKLNTEKLQSLVIQNFKVPYYSPGNLLTDYSVTNDQVLSIIGD